jgi:pimeloyl-ACP methyl ester carboxylesterase
VIFGHSMGGGVAVELASHKHAGSDYAALILESTFTRLPDVAKSAGVFGTIASWFSTQEFDSVDKIARIDAPILMMHGTADKTVPFALGLALYEHAPAGTRWVPFEGGSHSGLDREQPGLYRDSVRQMIAQLPS